MKVSYMEEQEEPEVMDVKCPRKLDFNAPLLSTRRPGGSLAGVEMSGTHSHASRDTSNRVPFSWELAPGKPKDLQRSDIDDENPLPPKLPPSRWHPSKEATDDDDDLFSDAIDMFSLSESIDIVETAEKVNGLIDGVSLDKVMESSGNPSPNFIIQRFLPAANALAASSVLTVSKNLNKKLPHPSNYPKDQCISRTGSSYSSPVDCGVETLFPWRMKHKICGVKCPVREGSSKLKPQSSTRRKQNSTSTEEL